MHKEKFMIYRRDAKKGEATYSPKSHSAPHFEGLPLILLGQIVLIYFINK